MPGQLVLRPAHGLAGYKRAYQAAYAVAPKRYKMALGVAQHMYRNRGKYYRAAKMFQRAWKRSRKTPKYRRRTNIGHPVGSGTAKRHEITNTYGFVNSRELNFQDLTDIDKTTALAINERNRNITNIRGFRICYEIANKREKPLIFHLAVVHDKRSNDATVTVTTNDFFRGWNTTRAVDFGIALGSMEMNCNPLNTERFTILKHKRIHLSVTQGATGTYTKFVAGNANYRMGKMWVPLKRQIRYEDNAAQSKVWLLWWCDEFDTQPASPIVSDAMDFNRHIITYFREPKSS